MKRIWITGAAGHIGSALVRLLDCRQYDILATDKAECDITDIDDVHSYFIVNRPDVVINCAGLTDLTECEENMEKAYLVNALGARNLAQEAQITGAKLIQMSTDDVFSMGHGTPFIEFDEANPRSIYGKSKYAGEKLVREMVTRHVIVRSSWVYGTGRDFVNEVMTAVKSGQKSFDVAENHFASPTSAKELAAVVLQFIENEQYGTYHVVCKGYCSRYDFAREILKITGNTEKMTLNPVFKDNAGRPMYSVLDNLMLRLSGMKEPMEWKTALKEYLTGTEGNI